MGHQDLKANIQPIEFGQANSQLRELADMCYERAQSSIQAPNVLSGEPGKSGETYRGLSARIEQATKQLSVVTRDFADAFEEILRKNAALNARFLPDEELFEIQNHDMEAVQLLQGFMAAMPQNQNGSVGTGLAKASRAMYERDYRVEIRADLRFATQAQRIGEADELVQMGQHPMLQQNLAFNYAAQVQALKARGLDHMIPLLGAKPPTPQMYGEQQIMQMAQQMAQQMVQEQMAKLTGQAPPGAPGEAPPAQGAAA
jgi:hypothetical protein